MVGRPKRNESERDASINERHDSVETTKLQTIHDTTLTKVTLSTVLDSKSGSKHFYWLGGVNQEKMQISIIYLKGSWKHREVQKFGTEQKQKNAQVESFEKAIKTTHVDMGEI